jgi:septum site-determining protein MinC
MPPFQLKGSTFTLPILKVFSLDKQVFLEYLEKTLSMSPQFFFNAPLILDFSHFDQQSQDIDLCYFIEVLRAHKLYPVALRSASECLAKQARDGYLACFNSKLTKEETSLESTTSEHIKEVNTQPPATLIVETPVRSGQQIYAKGTDLIILASVSAGAEILADGNIHVYGPLRGRVYAGISGNDHARIFCHTLAAEFISIAGRYLVCEHLDYAKVAQGLQIYLNNDQLKIIPLYQ